MSTYGKSFTLSCRQVPPLEPPCVVALPIDHDAFLTIVSQQRAAIAAEYAVEREHHIHHTLGGDAERRRSRTASQIERDDIKLKKSKLFSYYNDEDPFAARWLPRTSDIPSFPPREILMARDGTWSMLQPREGIGLRSFIASGARLLNMSLRQLLETDYLDALLFRFTLARHFDYAVSAKRFLCFRRLLFDYADYITFHMDDDVALGVSLGGDMWPDFYGDSVLDPSLTFPRDGDIVEDVDDLPPMRTERLHDRTPIICTRPAKVTWDVVTPKQFCKAWFYFALFTVSTDYFAQAIGCAVVGSATGMGYANVCKEFQDFVIAVIKHQSLPMKIHRVYAVNENFFVHNILWPIGKRLMSVKTTRKMVFLGKKYDRVLDELGPHRTPVEAGGDAVLPDDGLEMFTLLSYLTSQAS